MSVTAPPQVQCAFHFLNICQSTEFCEAGRPLTDQEEAVKSTALSMIQLFLIGEHSFGWPMKDATLKELEQIAQYGEASIPELAQSPHEDDDPQPSGVSP